VPHGVEGWRRRRYPGDWIQWSWLAQSFTQQRPAALRLRGCHAALLVI
jgi:hypothetical protein